MIRKLVSTTLNPEHCSFFSGFLLGHCMEEEEGGGE